jgi:hypothetical protein
MAGFQVIISGRFWVIADNVEVDAVGPDVNVLFAIQRTAVPGLVLLLPDRHQPRDGRGAQPGRLRTDQSLQGLGEVARADAFEVQPGDQFLHGLGLPQVRRQNRTAEPRHRLPGGIDVLAVRIVSDDPPIQHARLRHRDRADAGDQRAGRVVAVANHELPPALVRQLGVPFDPGGDLSFHRLPQQALRTVA